MKQVLLFAFVLMNLAGYSQYCGNSGTSICNISGTMSQPGFEPTAASSPILTNATQSTTVIQFKNLNQVDFNGNIIQIQSIRFDSIKNLPSGICWSTNKANNTYSNQEEGCIKLTGNTCSTPGQYKLRSYVTLETNIGPLELEGEQVGLNYYLRVINQGGTAQATNTNQTANFVAYGPSSSCGTPLAITLPGTVYVCADSTVTLNANATGGNAPYTYLWSTNQHQLACTTCANPESVVTFNTTYTVTVTDVTGQSVSGTVNYNLSGAGNPTLSLINAPTPFCQGDTGILSVAQVYQNYNWSTGSTAPSLVVTESDTYGLTVSGSGCTYTQAITIDVIPMPVVRISGDTSVVAQQAYTYAVPNNAGITYFWDIANGSIQSGQSTNSVTVNWNANGPYTLSLEQTNTEGCNNVTSLEPRNLNDTIGTGISKLQPQLISAIYPNPSKGAITIELLEQNHASQLLITDITGRIIQTATINEQKTQVVLNEAGVYFITVSINGTKATKRIVITE